MDNIEVTVLAIVEHIAARPAAMSSAIYQDLGIAGDKAWELLTDVAKKFITSFEGFEFELYFPEEAEARLPDNMRRRLTVGHLVEVARAGKWFEPKKLQAPNPGHITAASESVS
jgi:hypothetical protein